MDDFYRGVNIHKPHTYQQEKMEKFRLQTGKFLDFKMYVLHTMCKPVVLHITFLRGATHFCGLYYMLNNYKLYFNIDIPLNVPPTNYNNNSIVFTILNRFQMDFKVR